MKFLMPIEIEIEVECDYTAARPAPACQNHDDPRFSDSGDSAEIEITDMHFVFTDQHAGLQKKIKIPVDIMSQIVDSHIDNIMEVADQEHLDDISYAMAEKAYYDEQDELHRLD